MIQFLQRLDPSPASALTLRSIDHLPSLVVPLLDAVSRFAEIEDDSHQHGETTQVFEDFEEAPSTQSVCNPFPEPLKRPKGNKPAVLQTAF